MPVCLVWNAAAVAEIASFTAEHKSHRQPTHTGHASSRVQKQASSNLGCRGQTCQSELQETRVPPGPCLQPSYSQAQPTNLQLTGSISVQQIGQCALSCSRLKLHRPCADSGGRVPRPRMQPASLTMQGSDLLNKPATQQPQLDTRECCCMPACHDKAGDTGHRHASLPWYFEMGIRLLSHHPASTLSSSAPHSPPTLQSTTTSSLAGQAGAVQRPSTFRPLEQLRHLGADLVRSKRSGASAAQSSNQRWPTQAGTCLVGLHSR